MSSKPPRRGWLSWVTESGVLKKDVLAQDAAKIGVFYQNHGFIEAKVAEPVVEQKDDKLSITFAIEEGPRFRVGTVDVQGDLITTLKQSLRIAETQGPLAGGDDIGAHASLLLCFVVGRWNQFGKSGYTRDPMAQWPQQWGIIRSQFK